MVRRLLLIGGISIFALVAILFLAPFFLPIETLKRQLQTTVLNSTGWSIDIRGDVKISAFPKLRFVADRILVSPPNHEPILGAQQARFSLGVVALLQGNIAIDEIFLGGPNLILELDENGQPVWQEKVPAPSEAPPSGTSDTNDQGGVFATLFDTLSVSRFAIEDARLSFGKTGERPTKVSNLNLEASLPNFTGPLFLEGSAQIDEEAVAIRGEIQTFKDLLEKTRSPLNLTATYKTVDLTLNGQFNGTSGPIFDGDVQILSDDVSTLAGGGVKPGALKLAGTLVANEKQIDITVNDGKVYDTSIETTLSINTAGARPLITGSLDLGALDLDAIQTDSTGDSGTTTENETTSSSKPAEPDLTFLQAFDANLAFSSRSIRVAGQDLTDISGKVIVSDGVAGLTIDRLKTVAGGGAVRLNLNSNDLPVTITGSLQTDDLAIKPILTLLGQKDITPRPDGLLQANLVFGFRGLTPDNINASINARGSASLKNGSLSGLALADTFKDPRADRIDNINMTATIDSIANPVSVDGRALWRGQTITMKAKAGIADILSNNQTDVSATVTMPLVSAGYDGTIKLDGTLSGRANAKGQSLRKLAAWLGNELPPADGFEAFDIASDFSIKGEEIDLSKLNLKLDDIAGTGKANVKLKTIPEISGEFNFDSLNVDPYIVTESAGGGGQSNTSAASQSAGWSREPIDFSFLRAANIDLTANVERFQIQNIKAGPLSLKTTMANGKLDANLSRMGFYGGNGTATINLEDSGERPSLKTKLSVDNVSAFPFLSDAADFKSIEGKLKLLVDLTTSGRSQFDLVSALNGTMSFDFRDGALRGINIAKIMRGLTSGTISGWNNIPTEKTDFSEFVASFTVTNGIAQNDDLRLIGPLVRVTGAGNADIPNQRLKYRVNPKLVANLQGQGGQGELAGFAVPIIIEGPWAKPRVYPDIKGILENPQAALQQLRSLGGGFSQIASGEVGGLLNNLGGNNGVANVATAVQERTGVNLNSLIQDGQINREGGAAAAIGVIGGLLGGNRQNSSQQAAIQPSTNGIPVPRAKPRTAPPTRQQQITNTLQQVLTPNQNGNGGNNPQPNIEDAGRLLQRGLGNIFGN